jgi:hypothetical protein
MKLHWTELAALTALVGAACVAIYVRLTQMSHAIQERHQETERQLIALATEVKTLQARLVDLGAQPSRVLGNVPVTESQAGEKQPDPKPEVLAAITAAATVFLGKEARIRSVQFQPIAQDRGGTWAQQGRMSVQTSHNPRSRG